MCTSDTSKPNSFHTVSLGGLNDLQERAELRRREVRLPSLPLAHRAARHTEAQPNILDRQTGSLTQAPEKLAQHGDTSCFRSGTKLLRFLTGNKSEDADSGYAPSMTDIQSKLRARRENLGLTIRDLGERLGVVHSAVAKWENHTVDVPLTRIEPWAQALGLRVRMIVTPDDGQALQLSDDEMTDGQRALVRSVLDLLPAISDDEAEMLRLQMEGLAARRRKG
jgi:transcriptional regulator with XRE-family HTH domain